MSPAHALETLLVRALAAGVRTLPWRASLAVGARIGDAAYGLGLRRRVAAENLAQAFPALTAAERARLLRANYRELGRIAVEYARLGALAHAPLGEVIAEVRGIEHFHAVRAAGRGAVLLSGHFGNVELLGAWASGLNPVDFVVRAQSNPGVAAWIADERAAAGVGSIAAETGLRRIYEALRANRWVAMLADQDARRHGVFVAFLGRPASTAVGPARIALATGAALVAGFVHREEDGRHMLEVEPPLTVDDPGAPDAAARLTARYVALLERHVRARPEAWLWLHRRWKTVPPPGAAVVTP